MGLYRNNSTGFRGVTWREDKRMWHAKIGHKGKRLHLGYFTCPDEAAKAYDKAAKKFHKIKPYYNFGEPK